MALSIKNERTVRLAREVARETGETITDAIAHALEDRLAKVRARRSEGQDLKKVRELVRQVASLPDLDRRSPEEIAGYDEHGLPQ